MRNTFIFGLLAAFIILIASCQSDEQINYNRYYTSGAAVYQSHCQNCHGEKGEGLAAMIPPLTDTVFIKQHLHQLPCYLQNGLKGKISIHQKDFEGQMPATSLSPIEMAEVLTYVANSFGNKAGLIDNDAVVKDLKGCE